MKPSAPYRYIVKKAEQYYDGTPSPYWFIKDTSTGLLMRDKRGGKFLTYTTERAAIKSVAKLNNGG